MKRRTTVQPLSVADTPQQRVHREGRDVRLDPRRDLLLRSTLRRLWNRRARTYRIVRRKQSQATSSVRVEADARVISVRGLSIPLRHRKSRRPALLRRNRARARVSAPSAERTSVRASFRNISARATDSTAARKERRRKQEDDRTRSGRCSRSSYARPCERRVSTR